MDATDPPLKKAAALGKFVWYALFILIGVGLLVSVVTNH